MMTVRLEVLMRHLNCDVVDITAPTTTENTMLDIWQIAQIKAALDDAKAGRLGVPQDGVAEWVRPWGIGHEPPLPEIQL